MAFEGQQSVVAQHPAAIVRNPEQAPAAVFDFDADAGRARIEGVFQELFDDGNGPLNHLARRDLICDVV